MLAESGGQGLTSIAGRNIKGIATLGNSLTISYKTKHALTIQKIIFFGILQMN